MSEITIVIPSFPPSPPESPIRQFESSPDWFKSFEKPQQLPHGQISSLLPSIATPPLSPYASDCSETSSDDGEAPIPRRPRGYQAHHSHRRSSAPTYFTDTSFLQNLPQKPTHQHRARFASMPVTGVITPMWSIDEESSSEDEELRTPQETDNKDPISMLLPFCKTELHLPSYTFNEKDFVLSHVPHKRVNVTAFKPRIPFIPRWQRPIVMAVLCIMLFGSACVVSWLQQAAVSEQRASLMRRTVWLAKASAQTQADTEMGVDLEPGYKPVNPSHHSLKTQGKLLARHEQQIAQIPVELEMTPLEELAALMSFITGTAANSLPPNNPAIAIEPDVLLPFDPRSSNARAELDELVQTQWDHFPIMVLGKLRDPKMRQIRKVLKQYVIKPQPVFIDFDQRADATVLEPTLQRLLGDRNGPYVLLQGKNLEDSSMESIVKDDKVVTILAKTGAKVAKKLKKNKHAKEEERQENDRVLGPRAIFDE